jgi:hypothetical protein
LEPAFKSNALFCHYPTLSSSLKAMRKVGKKSDSWEKEMKKKKRRLK